MVNVPTHCWNMHHSTLIKLIDHCYVNSVGKRLSYWHLKSWDCSLTHWLPMKCILFLIETIQRYQFRCNYLKKKKVFLESVLYFWNLEQLFNISKQMMTLIDFVFPKLQTPKTWSDKCRKSPVLEDPSTSYMTNAPKHCLNQHHSTFSIFIDHCQVNKVGKSLFYWQFKSWASYQMYHFVNRDNLMIPIQIQLSQKKKSFSQFLTVILKCRLNFQYFERKDDAHRFWISEITDSENVVR